MSRLSREFLAPPALVGELDKALMSLPLGLRLVVLLRDQEGLECEEIAKVLNLPLGSVNSRLVRGRAQIRRKLV